MPMKTTPPTLEQIAAQTAEKIWKAIIMHRLTLPEDTDLDLKPLILTALRTATAQHAPTQGGDWAEAAAKEIQREWHGGTCPVEPISAIIRGHAPQPDAASVREAVRILTEHIGDLKRMAGVLTKAEMNRTAAECEKAARELSALTPLLGANEDRERLPFDEHVREILGWSCFQLRPYAEMLRTEGRDIPRKAEEEQAAALHWMLNLYLEHGADWKKAGKEYIEKHAARHSAPKEGGADV